MTIIFIDIVLSKKPKIKSGIPIFNLGVDVSLRDPRAKSSLHLHPRSPDPTGSRSHGDPTDQAIDVMKQTAKEMLVPQIANRTRNAIEVDGRQVLFFQRLRSGRRCSCWLGVNTSPHSGCPICYATGLAGGYYKWGTDHYLFDPSRQWIGMNTLLNPALGVPPWFSLESGFTSGYVEWDEVMQNSTYYGLDYWRFEYRKSGGDVRLKFKLQGSDSSFIPFTEEAFKERILAANGGHFKFRVYLSRAVASDPSPYFLFFMFRTLVNSAEPPMLLVDIPRRNESNSLQDFGILETYQTMQMVFSDDIQRINLEDVVVLVHDMSRWKVVESSPNDPMNILTSHDVQIRKAYEDEGIANIPI